LKFLPEEHKSISVVLKSKGYGETDYSFTKKQGLLFLEIKDQATPFCYYRKKESRLNANLKFEDVINYYVGKKKDVVVDNWEAVLEALEKHLAKTQIDQKRPFE
jgi:hypothetical protein